MISLHDLFTELQAFKTTLFLKNLNKANLKKNKYNITQPIDRVQRKKHCRLSCEKWKVYEMC